MSVHESNATVYWLSCDVPACTVTSEVTCHSRGRALNLAGGDGGWHLFGPDHHVCPTRDHPHEEAARKWYAESRQPRRRLPVLSPAQGNEKKGSK